MTTFVLVHGAWHGGWCWEKVAPLLEAAGHRAVAVDLPGRGGDPTPPGAITLESYVGHLCAVLEAQPEPVVLVGHSLGGVSITGAAERLPERIRCLVFVTAFLLGDGEKARDIIAGDRASLIHGSFVTAPDRSYTTVPREALKPLFFADCSDEDVERSAARLGPETTAIPRAAVHWTAERFGRLPRYYVRCLRDRMITPERQSEMIAAVGCDRVFDLDTGHSPFLAAPGRLVEILLTCAEDSRA